MVLFFLKWTLGKWNTAVFKNLNTLELAECELPSRRCISVLVWHEDWATKSPIHTALHPRWLIFGLFEEQKNSCLQVPWKLNACSGVKLFLTSHYENKRLQMSLSKARFTVTDNCNKNSSRHILNPSSPTTLRFALKWWYPLRNTDQNILWIKPPTLLFSKTWTWHLLKVEVEMQVIRPLMPTMLLLQSLLLTYSIMS